jgi:UDP-3-O-[3-hydroxymyristoyl] glucosamine N-acyltransferase
MAKKLDTAKLVAEEVAAHHGRDYEDVPASIVSQKLQSRSARTFPNPEGNWSTVLIHDTAMVAEDALFGYKAGPVGAHTEINSRAVIRGAIYANVVIGEKAIIGNLTKVGSFGATDKLGKISIGRHVEMGSNCQIFSPSSGYETKIGEGARLGNVVRIGEKAQKKNQRVLKPVTIGARALIADKVVVLPGASIGEDTQIERGYIIDPGVELPSGIRIIASPFVDSKAYKPQHITSGWRTQLRHSIEEIA